MSRTVMSRPVIRAGTSLPRLALVTLLVSTLAVGPIATGDGAPTPAAAVGSSDSGATRSPAPATSDLPPPPATARETPAAASGRNTPDRDVPVPAAERAVPHRAATPAPGAQAAGLSTEQPRTRSTTIVRQPKPPRSRCGGGLALGTVVTCTAIVDQAQDVWTVTTTAADDLLLIQLGRGTGRDSVGGRVTDATGREFCRLGVDANRCRVGAAGAYRISLQLPYSTGRGDYTIAAESTRTPSSCGQLPVDLFDFGSPGSTVTLPAGAAARCHLFDQPRGALLRFADPGGPRDIRGLILDGQQLTLCELTYGGGDCRLDRPGPYRLLSWEQYGKEGTHLVKARRLSDPAGCQSLPLARYGDPGSAVNSGVTPAGETTCHTFSTDAARPLLVRAVSLDATSFDWQVLDATGAEVCAREGIPVCAVPAAGRYTLLVGSPRYADRTHRYEVALNPLDRADGCAPNTGYTPWDQPALQVRQLARVQTNCHPFTGLAGERVIVSGARWTMDSGGERICTEPSDQVGCVLPADGDYRVISYREWTGNAPETYPLGIRRISDPVGCPTVRPGSYGTAPTGAPAPVACRILDVPAAGVYRVTALHGDNVTTFARVLDTAGRTVCAQVRCPLPAGRHTLLASVDATSTTEFAVSLLPLRPTGCTPVSDAGWADAPHRGRIDTSGQIDCLVLPTPSGASIATLLPVDAELNVDIVDADGEAECSLWWYTWHGCELDGPAPHSALLTGHTFVTQLAYTVGFARTDAPACPTLPRDTTDTTVTTGPDRLAACFTVPADQHAARQTLTWARTAGTGRARLTVFDGTGRSTCGTDRAAQGTVTCALPPGPVTVLLDTDGNTATYRLSHRNAGTS